MAGNPASISAGIACLEALQEPGTYERLDRLGAMLGDGLAQAADAHGIALTVNRIRGALSTHFCAHPVTNYDEAQDTDANSSPYFSDSCLSKAYVWRHRSTKHGF